MNTIYCEKMISKKRFEEITHKFSKLDPILVIGDVGIDKYTLGVVNKISPEAPVPVLEVQKEWFKLGLAANISHNLSTLGISSSICGMVGNDNNAKTFKQLLEEIHVSSECMIESSERPTIFKERVVTNTQQICRIDYENKMDLTSSEARSLKESLSSRFDHFKAVILEDYAKGMVTEKESRWIIDSCLERGLFVGVDPGRTTPPLYYRGATLLKPNFLEAKMMATALGSVNETKLENIASLLVEKLKILQLIITLGADGMALLDTVHGNGTLKIIPTMASEVFDVSGAGDTAMALLVAAIQAGATLEEAAWIGNCGSGVVVAKRGTATVNLDELKNYYHNLSSRI